MTERCHYCGSHALREDGGGTECKDCGVAGPAYLFRRDWSIEAEERLDRLDSAYCGLTAAARHGPPDPRSPFVQSIYEELRRLGR